MQELLEEDEDVGDGDFDDDPAVDTFSAYSAPSLSPSTQRHHKESSTETRKSAATQGQVCVCVCVCQAIHSPFLIRLIKKSEPRACSYQLKIVHKEKLDLRPTITILLQAVDTSLQLLCFLCSLLER